MSEDNSDQAKWWHSENPSPALSKSSLGTFFFETLHAGGKIGMIWPFNHHFDRSLVTVSTFMTKAQKASIEAKTKFRFRTPPRISLVQYDETRPDQYSDWKPTEEVHLKIKGAQWFHSDDHHSPSLSKAALGDFFYTVLRTGAQIGTVYLFKLTGSDKGIVYTTVYMTPDMKNEIEEKTRFKFRVPPGPAIDD